MVTGTKTENDDWIGRRNNNEPDTGVRLARRWHSVGPVDSRGIGTVHDSGEMDTSNASATRRPEADPAGVNMRKMNDPCGRLYILKTENPEPSRTKTGPDKSVRDNRAKKCSGDPTSHNLHHHLNASKPTKITPTTEEPEPRLQEEPASPPATHNFVPLNAPASVPDTPRCTTRWLGEGEEPPWHGKEPNRTPTQTPRYWSETLPPVLTGTTSH
ncbi:hypothetical protein pipiens_008194 [Culex pipiens pipiens]|uniref:Uncharacterized protein n=1 Tax=Culex pipiens pipiens TaxID=38569 RepID=A0ABD1DII9_CULPP